MILKCSNNPDKGISRSLILFGKREEDQETNIE